MKTQETKPKTTAPLALANCSALTQTDYAFNRSISSATYAYGAQLPAHAWRDVACDMRDWAQKCEVNATEYERRESMLRKALLTIATTELSGDAGSDLGCIRAIARMALSLPNILDQPAAGLAQPKQST